MMRKSTPHQAGQAATEFLIAAVFLVVPLFLIIPLLGKYIDLKHAAIGQARYSAWEYTVWNANDTGLLFGNPHDKNFGIPGAKVELNPLWRDHRGTPLLQLDQNSVSIKDGFTPPPLGLIGKTFEGLIEFLGDVFGLIGNLLHKMHVNAGFDVFSKDIRGYYTSDVNLQVRPLDQIIPRSTLQGTSQEQGEGLSNNDKYLIFRAKAAVLTGNWNASSPKNADTESKGLVITSLLSPLTSRVNDLIRPINKGLSHIPGFDIKLPGVPEFGDDKGIIPYEHLHNNPKKLQDKRGLSSYEQR